MADLNRLRAKFGVDRSATRRDDGLKTFEWRGDKAKCAKCERSGRNLNSDMKCTECAAGISPIPVPPKSYWAGLAAKWPSAIAAMPAAHEVFEAGIGSRKIDLEGPTVLLTHTGESVKRVEGAKAIVEHSKFYCLARYGSVVVINFGKIGSKGQEQKQQFGHEREAIDFINEKVSEKINKGYQRVNWDAAK